MGSGIGASIAVELLARPSLCLLDEPTSGLDPATARSLIATLRALADRGAGIAFTTHAVADVETCDRLLVLASGGRLRRLRRTAWIPVGRLGADTLTDLYRPTRRPRPCSVWALRAPKVAHRRRPAAR